MMMLSFQKLKATNFFYTKQDVDTYDNILRMPYIEF